MSQVVALLITALVLRFLALQSPLETTHLHVSSPLAQEDEMPGTSPAEAASRSTGPAVVPAFRVFFVTPREKHCIKSHGPDILRAPVGRSRLQANSHWRHTPNKK